MSSPLPTRQLALPDPETSTEELTTPYPHPVRLVWSLRHGGGEFACYLVPDGDGVNAHIFEDRHLLLAQQWPSERDALMFADALRRNLLDQG